MSNDVIKMNDDPCPIDACAIFKENQKCKKNFGATLSEFFLRGNVFEIAIGLVLALAFGKIVTSLISDLIMPGIAAIAKGGGFQDFFVILGYPNYKNIQEMEVAGLVPVGLYPDLNAAKKAGINIKNKTKVTSYNEAKDKGVNILAWGNFIEILIQFIIIALLLAVLAFGIVKLKCKFFK